MISSVIKSAEQLVEEVEDEFKNINYNATLHNLRDHIQILKSKNEVLFNIFETTLSKPKINKALLDETFLNVKNKLLELDNNFDQQLSRLEENIKIERNNNRYNSIFVSYLTWSNSSVLAQFNLEILDSALKKYKNHLKLLDF